MFSLRALCFCVIISIGTVPLVPPEHVHEILNEHGKRPVAHRHFDFEGFLPTTGHHAEISDDDPILVQDQSFAPGTASTNPVVLPALGDFVQPSATPQGQRLAYFGDQVIHGPPLGPQSLRAPPATFFL